MLDGLKDCIAVVQMGISEVGGKDDSMVVKWEEVVVYTLATLRAELWVSWKVFDAESATVVGLELMTDEMTVAVKAF
jgi:hypothetical protein